MLVVLIPTYYILTKRNRETKIAHSFHSVGCTTDEKGRVTSKGLTKQISETGASGDFECVKGKGLLLLLLLSGRFYEIGLIVNLESQFIQLFYVCITKRGYV